MQLEAFIEQFDYDGSVVLLEGKRNVPDSDAYKLRALSRLLAEKTQFMIFRSGNAAGADEYFSQGIAAVNANRLQVITPYEGHRQKHNLAGYTLSLDQNNLLSESELVYAAKQNTSTAGLVEDFVAGKKNKNTIKAAYILRDTAKVLGYGEWGPASAGIFFDDLSNPESGGTGHTIALCRHYKIPVFNQNIWFEWVNS
ncbi:MAG: hypothetical protein RLZZ161_483 [Bacteroidota bacterium]